MCSALAIPSTAHVNGSLDPTSGCPIVEIEVQGPFGQPQKFTAMVDTGFSGYLSLPILKAFPLGLILQGTMGITLADGTTHARLTARGMIKFDGKDEVGLVLLEWQNTDILLGMDFLAKFGKKLTVDAVNRTVEIVDVPAPPPAPQPSTTITPTPIPVPAPTSTAPTPTPPTTPPIPPQPKKKKRSQIPNLPSA